MLGILSLSNALNAMIPISRFNRGEANKIFDEVKASGCKVVVKNNTPACVLLTPERYQNMVDMLEDQFLLALAEERLKNDTGVIYTQKELMDRDGITYKALEKIPMEYGVDFE
jgi:PHD/YefM family antitoxin component YafN of YafNO toxin-antitoxin module